MTSLPHHPHRVGPTARRTVALACADVIAVPGSFPESGVICGIGGRRAATIRGRVRVIQHIVLIKWKPATTEQDIVEAFEAARGLLDEIDCVQKLTLGRDRAEPDHGFTHALIVNFADKAALRTYLDHPTRMRYVRERLQPLEEQRIEIDVPVDITLRRDLNVRDWEWGASIGMGPPPDD